MSGVDGDLPKKYFQIHYPGGWATVELPSALLDQMRELLATGNYGLDVADVVLRLIEEGCWRGICKARKMNDERPESRS